MELRVLRYFLTIAEEENMTQAAGVLHVTQPTLSRQIMQLEEELGVKLFKRGRYRMTLTEEGYYLKQKAEEILSLADTAARTVRGRERKEIAGELSIGCTETHSMQEMADRMAAFRSAHPKVSYTVRTMNTDGIRESLENGTIDIGLMTEPVDTMKFDTLRLGCKEQWGAIVRTDSELAGRMAVHPEDLAMRPLILPVRQCVRYTLESWFEKSFQELDTAARYNLGRNVAVMVQAGIGICIGFDLFSKYEDLEFIPLQPPLMTGSVLCWKRDQIFSPVAGGFIEFVKEHEAHHMA